MDKPRCTKCKNPFLYHHWVISKGGEAYHLGCAIREGILFKLFTAIKNHDRKLWKQLLKDNG